MDLPVSTFGHVSSLHGRDASSTTFCANSSIQFGVIDIFRNPIWRPPPPWIFKSCKFGTFRHVSSVVLELYIKFGSNIYDSHWDRCTYTSHFHLMTSRELTSGFDFWSRGHLRMPWCTFPYKSMQAIFIQSKVIDIFPKLKMAAAAVLNLFGWAMGPPTKPHSWCVPRVKMLS